MQKEVRKIMYRTEQNVEQMQKEIRKMMYSDSQPTANSDTTLSLSISPPRTSTPNTSQSAEAASPASQTSGDGSDLAAEMKATILRIIKKYNESKTLSTPQSTAKTPSPTRSSEHLQPPLRKSKRLKKQPFWLNDFC